MLKVGLLERAWVPSSGASQCEQAPRLAGEAGLLRKGSGRSSRPGQLVRSGSASLQPPPDSSSPECKCLHALEAELWGQMSPGTAHQIGISAELRQSLLGGKAVVSALRARPVPWAGSRATPAATATKAAAASSKVICMAAAGLQPAALALSCQGEQKAVTWCHAVLLVCTASRAACSTVTCAGAKQVQRRGW